MDFYWGWGVLVFKLPVRTILSDAHNTRGQSARNHGKTPWARMRIFLVSEQNQKSQIRSVCILRTHLFPRKGTHHQAQVV